MSKIYVDIEKNQEDQKDFGNQEDQADYIFWNLDCGDPDGSERGCAPPIKSKTRSNPLKRRSC